MGRTSGTIKPAAERLADAKRALGLAKNKIPVLEKRRREALVADDDAAAAAADLALEELHRSIKRHADKIDLLPPLVGLEATEARFPTDMDQARARLTSLRQRHDFLAPKIGIFNKPVAAATDTEFYTLRAEIELLERHIAIRQKFSAPEPTEKPR
jgi:hypothetical protein